MKKFDDICLLLMKTHSDYRNNCAEHPQGFIGKRREERLIPLLQAVFRSPKNPTQGLSNLFDFVICQNESSRLKNSLINAFFEIFELQLSNVLPLTINPHRNPTNSYGLAFSILYDNSGQKERDQEELIRKIKENMVKHAIKDFHFQTKRVETVSQANVLPGDISRIVAEYAMDQPENEYKSCPTCLFSIR